MQNTLYHSPLLAATKPATKELLRFLSKHQPKYIYQSNNVLSSTKTKILKNVYRKAKPDGQERGAGGDKEFSDNQIIKLSESFRSQSLAFLRCKLCFAISGEIIPNLLGNDIPHQRGKREENSMKRLLQYSPFVKNREETIDFKTFCRHHEIVETAPHNHVLSVVATSGKSKHRTITAYSLAINPLAFLDVHFVLAAGAVVVIAILERKLAENGIINLAAILSGFIQIAFPVVAFTSILILISKLGVFF